MKLQKSALTPNSGIQNVKGASLFHIQKKDIPIGTLKSIERQSGIKFS
jgi:hypothetical protein